MNKFYKIYAPVYYYIFGFYAQDSFKSAASIVENRDKILDVGIGTGLTLLHYPNLAHVVGIDISQPMLDVAVKNAKQRDGKTELKIMDAEKLEFPDGSFDKVILSHVLSTTPNPHKVYSEAIRVCKIGGEIAVVNHFKSQRGILKWAEYMLAPLKNKIGFNPLFELGNLENDGVKILSSKYVNFGGIWKFFHLKKVS